VSMEGVSHPTAGPQTLVWESEWILLCITLHEGVLWAERCGLVVSRSRVDHLHLGAAHHAGSLRHRSPGNGFGHLTEGEDGMDTLLQAGAGEAGTFLLATTERPWIARQRPDDETDSRYYQAAQLAVANSVPDSE
jgi:hypothetical protein